jgi:predicted nucleic acid-binding protein
MKRLFFDVNVLLDALLARTPHSDAAVNLWAAAERRQVAGFVPAHGVTTVFYLILRAKSAATARRAVADLLTVFRVAAIDHTVLQRALALAWRDFEDAVCAAAAEAAGCDFIVTRDPDGFKSSPLPTLNPVTALTLLHHEGEPDRRAERPQVVYAAARNARRGRRRAKERRAYEGAR